MHHVNTGLVPIHNKYFVRNLTLHHFLLSPEVWNIPVPMHITCCITYDHWKILEPSRDCTMCKRHAMCSQDISRPECSMPLVLHYTHCKLLILI